MFHVKHSHIFSKRKPFHHSMQSFLTALKFLTWMNSKATRYCSDSLLWLPSVELPWTYKCQKTIQNQEDPFLGRDTEIPHHCKEFTNWIPWRMLFAGIFPCLSNAAKTPDMFPQFQSVTSLNSTCDILVLIEDPTKCSSLACALATSIPHGIPQWHMC